MKNDFTCSFLSKKTAEYYFLVKSVLKTLYYQQDILYEPVRQCVGIVLFHKKNQPAVDSARGGHEGTQYGCVQRVECNTVQHVSLTDMPAKIQESACQLET